LERLPDWWEGPANSILGAHLGITDYLLSPIESKKSDLPSQRYQRNEDAAELVKQKKVSLAWIVRDAAEKYLFSQERGATG
jgi:hypothetical protein